MTHAEKICVDCMVAYSIGNFPLRENGKTRARCTPCFRNYANTKRRKERELINIAELPVVLSLVAIGQESWINVIAQILIDEKFLCFPKEVAQEELISLKALLKSHDPIANLVEEERENEKDSNISPCFDRRTSQS